jgi:putative membrane protein
MMMMGFGLIGLILMLIFWGGLILGALWLVRYLFQGNRRLPSPPLNSDLTPQQILDQRYARGEITRQQYELMKQDIAD